MTMSLATLNLGEEQAIRGNGQPKCVIEISKSTDYKKSTRILMCALFTTEELTTRCVNSNSQHNREPLDKDKVSLILEHITSRFTCDAVAVRAVMAQKLKDERNFHKKTKTSMDCKNNKCSNQ